ncbi:hypothetical protein [Gorillibacterium sp. CAU 1737]|uniref:hypothetical protein n=1 Tax=Gorillibacterium sp. CAU 1737 TaxID=3140362 RepID=UPI0032601CE6
MGGIEGLIGTITKVQKLAGTVQQLAPVFKLFSSLGKSSSGDDDGDGLAPVKRRRRKRRKSGGTSKKRRGTSKKGRAKKRSPRR